MATDLIVDIETDSVNIFDAWGELILNKERYKNGKDEIRV